MQTRIISASLIGTGLNGTGEAVATYYFGIPFKEAPEITEYPERVWCEVHGWCDLTILHVKSGSVTFILKNSGIVARDVLFAYASFTATGEI